MEVKLSLLASPRVQATMADTTAGPAPRWGGFPATALRRLLDVDAALLLGAQRLRRDSATRLMRALTRFGNTEGWILLGLVLLACGGNSAQHAVRLATASLCATLLTQLLKRTCRRTRPSLGICGFSALVENPDRFSFPSGHSSAAFAVAVVLIGQGVFLGPLMVALALGISVSRVYLGAHYPLDVGIGALLGAASGMVTRAAFGG